MLYECAVLWKLTVSVPLVGNYTGPFERILNCSTIKF